MKQPLPPMEFAGLVVKPGEKKRIDIPVSRLPTQTWVSIPVQVIYGIKPGPTLALVSGVHGDEINGMEVMREVMPFIDPEKLSGCIIMVPVVNIFGFLHSSRYLPDGRDLNRCFPGNPKGSMASRLAHLFSEEIIAKADYAIDFHTAALGRMNFPHIRANTRNQNNLAFAKLFGSSLIVHSNTIEGSFRHAAKKHRCQAIVFEGGEVNRFHNDVLHKSVDGVWHVLKKLKMCKPPSRLHPQGKTVISKSSSWIRANRSGIFRLFKDLGGQVKAKEHIGVVSNIFGDVIGRVRASHDGIIIGMSTDPKVHKGEAIVHVARL